MRISHLPLVALSVLALAGAGCAARSTPANDSMQPSDNGSQAETATEYYATSSDVMAAPSEDASSTSVSPEPMTLAFPGAKPAAEVSKKVRIKTTLGDIVIAVKPDLGPLAASNFVYLVTNHFYDGTIFHRVIPGFMIQGGDPTGTGRGGPGYQFDNDPVSVPYSDGVVAMANAGRNTNGSQFFIMVANYPLPPDYSVFGNVVEGLDVAHKIADVARDGQDRPLQDVKMVSVTVEE